MAYLKLSTTKEYLIIIIVFIIIRPYALAGTTFSQAGVCDMKEGTTALGTNVSTIDTVTSQDCCHRCHIFLGSEPCVGFTFTPPTQSMDSGGAYYAYAMGKCNIMSKITGFQSSSGTTSGYSVQQLFTMKLLDQEPLDCEVVDQSTPGSVGECGLKCLEDIQCRSFSWTEASSICKLMTNVARDVNTWTSAIGSNFYEIEYNFIASATPVDCTVSAWEEVSCDCEYIWNWSGRFIKYERIVTSGAAAGGDQCPFLTRSISCGTITTCSVNLV